MPRSRATELPQRPSPRAPHSLRTSSSSDSDPVHHRSRTTERSPRLSDGRSPRGTQSEPLNQRKLGSRIADLESQLGQAQDELKSLKNQLASAEAAKTAAQELLDKKSRKPKRVPNSIEIEAIVQITGSTKKHSNDDECDDVQKETDVFEVPVEESMPAPGSLLYDELAPKNDGITLMKSKLDEKEKELEAIREENAKIKSQLHEKISQMEEMSLRLKKADQEVEKSKESAGNMKEKLEATERAKEELENEMKKLRIQTEQWRKAADAAATVLAGEVEINARRISERCGSMEKSCGNSFDSVGGYVGSPNDSDDIYGGKRKGSGMRMFGDLWKKKGNK